MSDAANPESSTTFAAGDIVGLLGDGMQVAAAEQMITLPATDAPADMRVERKPLARAV
jgi:hypothetical protein